MAFAQLVLIYRCRYSRDGPGRGVTSRLYKNVLQKHASVVATATISASYSDAVRIPSREKERGD